MRRFLKVLFVILFPLPGVVAGTVWLVRWWRRRSSTICQSSEILEEPEDPEPVDEQPKGVELYFQTLEILSDLKPGSRAYSEALRALEILQRDPLVVRELQEVSVRNPEPNDPSYS